MLAVSYLFHLLLGLLLAGLSLLYFSNPQVSFHVGVLPWEGETLAWVLLGAGLTGLVLAYLAFRRVFAVGLLIWSVVVLAALVWGCFLSRYSFGRDGPTVALLLLVASAVAVVGSWLGLRCRAERLPSYGADAGDSD